MGTTLQLIHDTDANLNAYVGSAGEVVVSSTDNRPRAMNGSTAGGFKLAMLSDLTPGAWQSPTLASPWIAYGGGFTAPRYRKDSSGLVTIEGLMQAGSGSTTGTIFTLLAGYRPTSDKMFVCWCGGGAYRLDVKSTGDVVINSGNLVFTSFSGVQFYAD